MSHDFFAFLPNRPVLPHLVNGLSGKHLLITGGTGFFGLWLLSLLDKLNQRGEVRVTVVSRNPARFLQQHTKYQDCHWLHWHAGDVRLLGGKSIGSADFVLHAAADTSQEAHARPLELFESVVHGTRQVLDLALRSNARRVLLIGSGAQYGPIPFDRPIDERSQLACDSKSAGSAYGEAKRAQETLAAIYAREKNIEVVFTRCFAFSGAGLPLDAHFAIGNFVRDALFADAVTLQSSGDSVRSYLHGADLAVWLLFLLVSGQPGEAYNIGSDEALSIAQLAHRVTRRLAPHKPIHILGRFDAPRSYYVPNIDKARSLGLDAWTSLEASIDNMSLWARHRLHHSHT